LSVEFFRTMMGKKFFESDVPRLVSAFERIAKALEERIPPKVEMGEGFQDPLHKKDRL